MPLRQARKQMEKELGRTRGLRATDTPARTRGSVTGRSQGRPKDPNQQMRRTQRDLNREAQRTANQARREANNPQPRSETPWASTEPRATGATGLREQRTREAIRMPPRTENFNQAEQAAIIGAGNQPADGVGNGQPTMAERYRAASPEERAAMVDSQKIEQTLGPESLPLLAKRGLLGMPAAMGGRAITSTLQNATAARAGNIATSALRNPAGRTGVRGPARRPAGSKNPSAEGRIGTSGNAAGTGQAGRSGLGPKPRVRANADGAVNYGAAAATPGAAAATETAKTLTQRALGLGRKTLGLGAISAMGAGLTSSSNRGEQAGAAPGDSAQAAEEAANAREAQVRELMDTGMTRNEARAAMDMPDRRSFVDRATSGVPMTQADFDAAGFGGQGLRVDGNRQGNVPQWMEDRFAATSPARAPSTGPTQDVPVTANSRFEALRNRRLGNTTQDERRAGLRAGQERLATGGANIERADPVINEREMGNIQRRARFEANSARSNNQRQVQRMGLSPGRRARALAGMPAPTTGDMASQMIDQLIAARSPNEAQQAQIGLREEARQADQTNDTTLQLGQSELAQRDLDSQRRLAAAGLRAQGASGAGAQGSVLGPGGDGSPENVRRQADATARGVFSDLTQSNVNRFESVEEVAAALDGWWDRAGTQQAAGELPAWVDDSMGRDLFTITNALANTERGGLFGLFGGTRGDRGQPEIDPANSLRLIIEMVQNEDGNKWTEAGGQRFNLSKLDRNAARLYGDLASRLKPLLEGQ